MTTLEAMRSMLDSAGLSAYGAAKKIGRAHTYVSNLFTRGTTPNGDRLATIADACGYDLMLVPRDGGEAIVIDGTSASTSD